jgi:SAM-dependent methyltransferase
MAGGRAETLRPLSSHYSPGAPEEPKVAQNIYDQPEFFAAYSQLPRSVHGLDGAPEWSTIRSLLPKLEGKRVVDLGCGFGWFARWARQQGAKHVLGIDLSANMIARAKADTADPAIEYVIADLEHLRLSESSFDLAYSSFVLHYISDFDRLTKTIFRALVADARFIFTIEHPIYMAPTCPGWSIDREGRKAWPVNHYSIEGPRTTDWLAKGVVKQHRTIGTTLNTLMAGGFTIRQVCEWAPAAHQVAEHPDLAEELERPMILIVAVQR